MFQLLVTNSFTCGRGRQTGFPRRCELTWRKGTRLTCSIGLPSPYFISATRQLRDTAKLSLVKRSTLRYMTPMIHAIEATMAPTMR